MVKGAYELENLGKSLEDYLETILILQKKSGMVLSIDVARYMGFSKPSVCHAVKLLREKGCLDMDKDGMLHLTEYGRDIAERIYERHCFFTKHLTSIGVSAKQAEQDACQIEHIISEESFQKLKETYGDGRSGADGD